MFISAFNHASLNNFLASSNTSNCENLDWAKVFTEINEYKHANEINRNDYRNVVNLINNTLLNNENIFQNINIDDTCLPDNIGMTFVFGYILKNVFKKHNCSLCKAILLSDGNLNHQNEILCYFKAYENAADNQFNRLHICNKIFFEFLLKCEEMLNEKLPEIIHTNNVGKQLVNMLLNVTGFPSECCEEVKINVIKFFVKLRLFYILKFTEKCQIVILRINM